jgi:pSer/pThr/pTyr-binding forkhead associated (FHA) protein
VKVVLKFLSAGKTIEQSLNLNTTIIIGRGSKSDTPLLDDKISGRHCRLALKIDRLELSDLDSKNGTYLNGIRIEQSEVFIGDEIRVGDTLITIEEKKMEKETIDVLTFPGPTKDRLNYELKADFTGARILNQSKNRISSAPNYSQEASRIRETDLRKKVKSKLKLSKQEIRKRNKFAAMISTFFDAFAFLIVLSIPLLIVAKLISNRVEHSQRLSLLITMELIAIGIFIVSNYKFSKFTIGEKIGGIKKLYIKQ